VILMPFTSWAEYPKGIQNLLKDAKAEKTE
jgi:hypothetical protein